MPDYPDSLYASKLIEDWRQAAPQSVMAGDLWDHAESLEIDGFYRFKFPLGRTGFFRPELPIEHLEMVALAPLTANSSGEPLGEHDYVALDVRQVNEGRYLLCPGFLVFQDGWFYFSPDGVQRVVVSPNTVWRKREP